ncbi:type I-E CRISPR-associated protein Cse1/CasA [Xenorhabdus sp. DI]|uniref:type I-E CRISPR-associated protein Cse1/CasA n=1 Tax=Xenorhabdus doucetiae TaxID=351671 RepID=UPI0019B06850|nr:MULTISPECIES: type I-E CRISPR-associated protein Cse1/CasA [unclassified Xenorhabdus]MBD2783308.1 type I-E CRISPR-associated protein Cse1/CasA [Xenorhabdus sp. 3]MBD2788007.1 type I-E CRISPR-associated protein Cse1/CasA [Xenorhabdus sp. DI]
MNLVKDAWLTFKMRNGGEEKLPLAAICDPAVVDFALPRADFQGAAYQLAIGLLQTVFAPEDKYAWHEFYQQAPTAADLQAAFNRVEHAFNLTGDGPLFMQDFDSLAEKKSTSISGLLIESPGEKTVKDNADHFIKRGQCEVISPEMAAIALFTLQINAPSGGAGHRVGLRGGGPLTTLIQPQAFDASLWQKLWLNVIHRAEWRYTEPDLKSAAIFPWLGKTHTSQKKGTEIYAHQVHDLHMYWAMPRRIRLEIVDKPAVCQLTGQPTQQSVTGYRSQNHGNNYAGSWRHPLTPYRWNPKKEHEEHISIKCQSDGITYKIWDSLTFSDNKEGQEAARVVDQFNLINDYFADQQHALPRLWAFGYDMDNMKARGWYSASLPLFFMPIERKEAIFRRVKELQHLSVHALTQCRSQIKNAWFHRPTDMQGDMSFIDAAFYQRTHAAFFNAVQQIVNSQQAVSSLSTGEAKTWLYQLRNTCFDLFDEFVLSENTDPQKLLEKIEARQMLTRWLMGSKDIKAFMAEHKIETQLSKKKKEVINE